MYSKFVGTIKKTIPLNHNVIAAVSGGVDSMVLCDLLLKSEMGNSEVLSPFIFYKYI